MSWFAAHKAAEGPSGLRRGLVAAMATLSILVIIVGTRWGSALGDDSYWYIKPARDALAGQALIFNPLYPPFLPLLLTATGYLGLEPVEAIRFLNAILFGVTIAMTFLIMKELTRSFAFSFLAAAIIAVSAGLIEVYASALSEPLYISLMLGSFYCISQFTKHESKAWLTLAAIGTGTAMLTRYMGVTVLVSITALLMLERNRDWRRKLANALLFAAISILPISVYAVRNYLAIGRPVGHSGFSWELVRQFPLTRLLSTMLDWFIPGRFVVGIEQQLAIVAVALILAIGLGIWFAYRDRVLESGRELLGSTPFVLLALFVMVNLVTLAFARGFLSGGDPFDPRYMSPVQLAMFLLAFAVLEKLYGIAGKAPRLTIGLVIAGLFALLGARALYTIQFLYREGLGYSSQRWHVSETIAYLNRFPETPVMATGASGIYFRTGRRPTDIPRKNHLAQVNDFLCETDGLLVTIDSMPADLYGIDHAELTEGLLVEYDFSEGTVYRQDPTNCE